MTVFDAISSPDAAIAAAEVLAEQFGLGAEITPSNMWPVDEGDTILSAKISGDCHATLLLAVNNDVAGRLQSDPDRFSQAMQLALDKLVAVSGGEFTLGDIGTIEATPKKTVEILDDQKITALFAVYQDAADQEANEAAAGGGSGGGSGDAGDEDDDAVDYEPEQLNSMAGTLLGDAGPLSLLHDVDMDVTVELGRTTMPIRELLSLQPGMVVEIDRVAGTPIDVLVNGRRIAAGEVVVIDEEFGVRITEIVAAGSPA